MSVLTSKLSRKKLLLNPKKQTQDSSTYDVMYKKVKHVQGSTKKQDTNACIDFKFVQEKNPAW